MRMIPFGLAHGIVFFVAATGCGSSSATRGTMSSDEDSGSSTDAASDAPHSDAQAALDASIDGAGGDSATLDSGVHNGSCCVRSANDDSMCASRGQAPEAFVCFCPVGGDGGTIDPSCTINMGTELVCCPE